MLSRLKKLCPIAAWLAGALVMIIALGGRLWSVVWLALWALVIAYLLSPLVKRFERTIKRPLAVAAAYLTALLSLAVLSCAVLLPALAQFGQLAAYLPALGVRLAALARGAAERLDALGIQVDIQKLISEERLTQLTLTLVSGALERFRHAAAFFAKFIAVMALAFFNLLEWERISLRITLFVPSRARATAIRVASAVRREMGMYLRGQIIIICLVSALAVAALTLIGVPSPLALGLMYGMMNALPYFGPLLGTIPPVLAALAVDGRTALITLGSLLIIQQIDNYIFAPRVIGAYSGLTPATVLLTLSAGSLIGGVAGMFLALPVMLAARVALRVCLSARLTEPTDDKNT